MRQHAPRDLWRFGAFATWNRIPQPNCTQKTIRKQFVSLFIILGFLFEFQIGKVQESLDHS